MTNICEKDTECPEMEYFMNDSLSDVLFLIEGQRLPALKAFLSVKNKVFRELLGDKSSKDDVIPIKETSFEAFKTLIRFLYCDQLVLKDKTDIKVIDELCQLSQRFVIPRLLEDIKNHLLSIELTAENVGSVWDIGFNYKLQELIDYVMTFVGNNFDDFVNDLVNGLNDSTHSQLLKVLAFNFKKINKELGESLKRVDLFEKGRCNHCGAVTKIPMDNTGVVHCVYGSCRRVLPMI